jgi:LysR family hydrogen peroxide-inducible transcriptional activator
VVPKLRARFPRLELLLVEEKTPVLVQMLIEGKLDAAGLAMPLHDDRLHAEFLFEEPFVLAVPRGHELAQREALKVEDLADRALLLLEDGHCLREQALDVCHLAGSTERTGFRATSLETLRQMVAADVGITLLPSLAVKPPVPRSENLALVPFAGRPPSRRIALAWRRTTAMAPFLQRLAGVIAELPAALLTADPAAATLTPAAAPRRRRGA